MPSRLYEQRCYLLRLARIPAPTRILLYGPAGTGKTTIAHALATEIGADIHELSAAQIYGKWLGDAERAMQAVFDQVRRAKKSTILFLDEMEGVVNIVENSTSGSRATNAVAGIFKTESVRVTTENPNVILVAATNDPDRIDAALIRTGRFDIRIPIGLPSEVARRQMFGNLILNHQNLDIDARNVAGHIPSDSDGTAFVPYDPSLLDLEALSELARLTGKDFSAADIVEIFRQANLAKALEEERSGCEPAPIDLAFLSSIITNMRRARP